MKLKQYMNEKYNRIAVYTVITAVVIMILYILLSLSGGFFRKLLNVIGLVLKPIVFGGIIAYLLEPAVQRIEKLIRGKAARPAAVLIIGVLILALLFGLLIAAGIMIKNQIGEIKIDNFSALFTTVTEQVNGLYDKIRAWLSENMGMVGTTMEKISSIFGSAGGSASDIFFALIFAVYLLLDSENIGAYWSRVLDVFIKPESREKAREIIADADHCFSSFIRGKIIDALLVFAMITLAMFIYRVPYAFAIGLMTAVGNLIPFVGPIGGIIALLVVCLSEGLMSKFIVGTIILVVLMTIDANIFNPKLVSSSISIHPLLVFTAMIAGGAIGGVSGMLISAPTAALLKIEFDKFIDRKEAQKNQPAEAR